MKSNYKAVGKYIQIVDERNNALQDLPLMGLSVSKVFFPTIANLVGTDMKTYKIVYRNQFTYIADTSRRGDKIAIALNDRFDKMLVSQAYTPFENRCRCSSRSSIIAGESLYGTKPSSNGSTVYGNKRHCALISFINCA